MNPRRYKDRGSVLVTVLWTLVMLSIFLAAITRQVSAELVFGRWMMDRVLTRHLATSGVERVILEIQSNKFKASSQSLALRDSAFGQTQLGEGTFEIVCNSKQGYENDQPGFHYGLCDEYARLNINTASEAMIKKLFQTAVPDMEDKKSMEIAQAVIDWRDGDNDKQTHGAESAYYKSQPMPYEPRNAPFESLEELQLVKGITPAIYRAVNPFITVYTDGRVNFNTVSLEILQVLGLSEGLAAKIVEFRNGADREEGTRDDEIFQFLDGITATLSVAVPFSPEDLAQLSNLMALNIVTLQSDVFRIYSIGRLIRGSHKVETRVTGVLRRDGTVLYWREG